ncbi:hypothetical protein [Actinocorallia herbida]|uniref:hypothetical protein n=1 Tax=Actinocorallia herbida TaxID=58109 RepID=UPI0011CE26A4|nr:hypothetical protein [Actinocorallia herbida]
MVFLIAACGGESGLGDQLPTGDTSVGGERGPIYQALRAKNCDRAQELLDAADEDFPNKDLYLAGIANCKGNRKKARAYMKKYREQHDMPGAPEGSPVPTDSGNPSEQFGDVWYECYLIKEVEGGSAEECAEPPPETSPGRDEKTSPEKGTRSAEPTRTEEPTTMDPSPEPDSSPPPEPQPS